MRIHKTRRICTCDRPGRSREKLHRFRFGISGLLRRIQGQICQYAETPGGYAYGKIESKAARFFDKMAALDLLIIDDFGMKILDGQQLLDFMELIEDRHGRKSTIIASQLPVKNWYDILAKNPTIADAILDRVVKSAYRIDLNGVSMRK